MDGSRAEGGGGATGGSGGGGKGNVAAAASAPTGIDFDFEASAFGVDSAAGGQPSGPPAPLSAGDMAMMSMWGTDCSTGVGASLSDGAGRYRRPGAAAAESYWSGEEGEEDMALSSHKVAEALAPGIGAEGLGQGRTLTERLGKELLDRRRELDKRLAGKSRREAEIEEARRRLDDLQARRRSAAMELSARQSDVERLVTRLSFTRRRIEETEREVATMREARDTFGQEELAKLRHRFGDLAKASSSFEREKARDELRLAAKDSEGGPELKDRVERVYRRRADLQARQQLLVAGQAQSESERLYGRREVETAREELAQLQAGRLRASEEKLTALEEAARAAKDLGVGPGVVEELFQQTPLAMGAGAAAAPPRRREAFAAESAPQPRGGLAAATAAAQAVPEWSPPQNGGEPGEVAAWWRSMLATQPGTAPGSARGPASARERAPPQQPQRWAHFGTEGPSAAAMGAT